MDEQNKRSKLRADIGWIILIIVFGIALTIVIKPAQKSTNNEPKNNYPNHNVSGLAFDSDFVKFQSVDEFVEYLGQTNLNDSGIKYLSRSTIGVMAEDAAAPTAQGIGGGEPGRVSETNVQVAGVDEPDIVKTDGQNIFVSTPYYYRPYFTDFLSAIDSRIMPPTYEANTAIVDSWPVEDLAQVGSIDKGGQLLLEGNRLVVFSDRSVVGYDVTDKKNPVESWEIEYSENTWYNNARLHDGNIYLVSTTYINSLTPCPYQPLVKNGQPLTIPCIDIYHPLIPSPTDSTYTINKINIDNGEISESVSFTGAQGNTIVYMSAEDIFVAYQQEIKMFSFISSFISDPTTQSVIPQSIRNRAQTLSSYDISESSKVAELQTALAQWLGSLSADEQLRISSDLQNLMSQFYRDHQRELGATGIVRISTKDLEIHATGAVPGYALNQFSLDQYQGNLRIATTIGDQFLYFGPGLEVTNATSFSDVYVLNSDLDIVGSVTDLGQTERIYSVRFIGDKGYVVTFRQVDPFYVLDLSNPHTPKLSGELKIPGYSSYLHPVNENLILGIGQESSRVKLSLFDVSDPSNPTEVDKYSLNEYWTEIANNHHAFLLDDKFKTFFIPGGNGAYIFSYENNKLSLENAAKIGGVQRALFIDDYLYLVSPSELVVLSEKDWSRVADLKLNLTQ